METNKGIKNFLFSWVKDNYDKTFIAVLILAFLIRLWIFSITKTQPLWWDAADYLATAKRWAGLNPHFVDMWYYRRGFFWPLFSSIFFRLGLGENGIRFSIILFSTGIVFVSYFLIKNMFNKKLALWTSICLSMSWIFLFFSGRPLTNLPATFFLLTSLLFFWKAYMLNQNKKFFYLFGLFFALACLTRMQYLMFSLPLLVLVFMKEKFRFLKNKYLWLSIGIFFIMFIPQLIVHNQHFGNPFLDLTTYYLGIGGSASGEVGVQLAQMSDLFVYINNLPYILDSNNLGYNTLFAFSPFYILFVIGFFSFLFEIVIGFDKIFKNRKIQKRIFVLFWIVFTFITLGYMAPQLEQRYVIQTLPFLFLVAVYPIQFLINYIHKNHNIDKKTLIFCSVFLIIILLIPNFNFGKGLTEGKKTSYLEVKQAGEWIKENSESEDIIVAGSLPQMTYYSERAVYPFGLAYRRDLENQNEFAMDKFIKENKPKYFMISIFEREEDWAFAYPSKHQDTMIPVQVYGSQEQPVLVIYEFKY